MASFTNLTNAGDGSHLYGFGNMPHGTTYVEYDLSPWTNDAQRKSVEAKSIDYRKNTRINPETKNVELKANIDSTEYEYSVGTNYGLTSGYAPTIIPIFVDQGIVDTSSFDTPLYNGLIKKVTNRTLYVDYNKMTAKGSAVFLGEDAALPAAVNTYSRAIKTMKYLYVTRKISGPMMATDTTFGDLLRQEVTVAHKELAEHLEKQICQGTDSDSAGFNGFYDEVTTNTTNGSGTATITIGAMRDMIRTCREANGHPNLFVTDYKTLDDIKALIQNQLKYVNTTNIAWGITAVEFEGIPIIADLGMNKTATTRELHLWDTSVAELRVLADETFEELAKDNDGYKFMIKWYGVLVIKAENFCYRYYGLA